MPFPDTRQRLVLIDALRGVAIVLMVVFHFCFDLAYFGFADFDFYQDAFWLNSRTFILSLFLVLVGISLVLATSRGLNLKSYLRRLGVLIASAALISLSTWWMFGDRFVFFGVIHFIALASVVGLLFVRGVWSNMVLGIALIGLAGSYQSAWFDQPGWRWIGLMTHKPLTEDYVPLLPWFGVVLIGVFIGRKLPALLAILPAAERYQENRLMASLAWGGRHSLLIYLLHQPVLMGTLRLYATLGS